MAPQISEILRLSNRFGEIPISAEVRVGLRRTTVREVVQLQPGSIVTLDKPAGETFDLMIGDFRLATVEVVVVGEGLAVRITELHVHKHAPEPA